MSVSVALYLPALHKGYLNFLKAEKPENIYLLATDILSDLMKPERHLRALDESEAALSLEPFFPNTHIVIVTKNNVQEICSRMQGLLVMPDEDVSHDFSKMYLENREVIYKNAFLRYDKKITQQEFEIPAHRALSEDSFHKEMIAKVTELTKKSDDWWRQIAALAVKDGKIVFEAFNRHLPSSRTLDVLGDPRSNFDAGQAPGIYTSIHAEAHLVAKAAHDGVSLKGAEIYATTFPCPNCARLLVEAGITKVYYDKGYSLLDAEQIFNHNNVEIVKVVTEEKKV
jgi:dCMP deaminase